MKQIGAYDAKTKLASLLEEVSRGQEFTITKHGVPIALLIPVRGKISRKPKDVIREILELRRGREASSKEIKRWVAEGRKY